MVEGGGAAGAGGRTIAEGAAGVASGVVEVATHIPVSHWVLSFHSVSLSLSFSLYSICVYLLGFTWWLRGRGENFKKREEAMSVSSVTRATNHGLSSHVSIMKRGIHWSCTCGFCFR